MSTAKVKNAIFDTEKSDIELIINTSNIDGSINKPNYVEMFDSTNTKNNKFHKSFVFNNMEQRNSYVYESVNPIFKIFRTSDDLMIGIERDSDFAVHMLYVMERFLGSSKIHWYRTTLIFDLSFLIREYDNIFNSKTKSALNSNDYGYYNLLKEIVRQHKISFEKKAKDRIKNGMIEMGDLKTLFKDKLSYWKSDNIIFSGKVVEVNFVSSWMEQYWMLSVEVIHGLGLKNVPVHGIVPVKIYPWYGLKNIADLPVKLLTENSEQYSYLLQRGKKISDLIYNRSYVSYNGKLTQSDWWGNKIFSAEGRIMVDMAAARMVAADNVNTWVRSLNIKDAKGNTIDFNELDIEEGTAEEDKKEEISKKEDFLLMYPKDFLLMYPRLMGFSFRAKQWGFIDASQVENISWRDDAFDKLVLDEKEKHVVKSLVEYSGSSFEDLIDGKGGGCVFLLHGPPGQGKTLTAETVAEFLKRPLYSVSVGELGTDPETLENKLRAILDLATVWNAVLLLDEADIFLEERNETDIIRNAMVGVFLRLLEYHQGVLFLTTNRVKNIDNAFYSRISVALKFDESNEIKRYKVWKNLLSSAQISLNDDEIKELAVNNINGRQIKNIIRITQTLALAENRNVRFNDFKNSITFAMKFEHDMMLKQS